MIKIGICDDDRMQREVMKKMCDKFFETIGMEFEAVFFSSGEEVVSFSDENLLLLFLDIEMEGMDGISSMKHIEKMENIWRIVFVSGHEEAVFDTFGIKTLGFIRKPVEFHEFEKWLQIALKEFQANKTIIFETQEGKKMVPLDQILFMEAQGNYVSVYKENENFLANGNLKKWENEFIDSSIIRVHKSYLVNLAYLEKMDPKILLTKSPIEIPVGRQYKKMAKQSYECYILSQVRKMI